ncbi:MAG: MFS transporter [Roseiflexaceae bacterium]|nr:MFS transporter [Roseiflexaceae bacterium]
MYLFNTFRRRAAAGFRSFFQPADTAQRNIRNVLLDGVGVGLVNGIATFLPVFLVRLNASSFLVGLLTALPALAGMLLALPIGRLLEGRRNIVPWYTGSRQAGFAAYLLIGLAPFVLPPDWVPIVIILIWALATVPQTMLNVAFTVVMGAVAGPDRRYFLMSRRWSILGLTTAGSVALCGWVLNQVSFPLNYQLIFIGSFLGGVLSFAFASRIDIPDNTPVAKPAERLPWRERTRAGVAALRQNRAYSQFVGSQLVFRFGMGLGLPLFPLYWVRELDASDAWIGVINTTGSAVLLVAYFMWASLTRRHGAGLVLRICTLGIALYPLVTALTTSALPLPLYAGLANIFLAGIELVLFDILLSTTPPGQTASYVALYQLTTYIALFFGPLIGTVLADAFGFGPALIAASALRFVGLALFVLFNIGAQPPKPTGA